MESQEFLTKLNDSLNRYFSLDEIRTINFNLGIDYDSIPGEAKPAKIRELLIILGRQDKLGDLLSLVSRYRPNAEWPLMPQNFELPTFGEWSISSSQQLQEVNYGDVIYGNKFGGDYVGGDKISGDKIGGDKISVGNISGSAGIAIGRGAKSSVTIYQDRNSASISAAFAQLNQALEESQISVPKKLTARNALEGLKEEAQKGDYLDESNVKDWLDMLLDLVPDIGEIAINTFLNPSLGFGFAFRKIAAKTVNR